MPPPGGGIPPLDPAYICLDGDHDDYGIGVSCKGADCDDANADVNPGATEVCGDGVDNDCQGGDAPCSGSGSKRCFGPLHFQQCSNNSGGDCQAWSEPVACPQNNVCISGACVPLTQPQQLWVINFDSMNDAERLMMQSLQGVVAKQEAAIWIQGGGLPPKWLEQVRNRYGIRVSYNDDPWWYVDNFKSQVSGYILCDLNQSSSNVASGLAGVLDAIAVDSAIEQQVRSKGISLALDVRGRDEKWALQNYGSQFTSGLLVEQKEDIPAFLRDLPAFFGAFTYFDGQSAFRTTAAQRLGPNALVFGWGYDETAWVTGMSQGNAGGVAADFATNLSALMQIPAPQPRQPNRLPFVPHTEPDVHYVAVVMSDGDNVQMLMREFERPNWWGSSHRGTFTMNWEMAQVLSWAAPLVLEYYYQNASSGLYEDYFVSGPSGHGYMFPNYYQDLQGYAKILNHYAKKSDLRIITIINSGGQMNQMDPILEQGDVLGCIYKDYEDYNRRRGEIYWHDGKPCVSFKYLLWEGLFHGEDTPSNVAAQINAAPKLPKTNSASYSLVNVHAWSYWGQDINGTGCMDGVKQLVSALGDKVRVVSAEELFALLRQNFGTPLDIPLPPVRWIYEAENIMSHQVGFADGQGWACDSSRCTPNHMAYGPYAEGVPAGLHRATFRMMVGSNSSSNHAVASLDVHDANAGKVLAAIDVKPSDFGGVRAYQDFDLDFRSAAGSRLEFRVYWHGPEYLNIDKVDVR